MVRDIRYFRRIESFIDTTFFTFWSFFRSPLTIVKRVTKEIRANHEIVSFYGFVKT